MRKKSIKIQIIAWQLMVIILSSCSTTVYQSLWQSKSVKADGNPEEWSTPLRFYEKNSKLYYTVSNDSENLYLCIIANEEQVQMKIIQSGIQLWIDTTGKNKQQIGIMFPLADQAKNIHPSNTRVKGQNPDSRSSFKKLFISEFKEMTVSGFRTPIEGTIPTQNNYGISVNINCDSNNVLVYEAIIPFKTFYKQTLSASDSTKILGISIIVNAMQEAQMPNDAPGGGMKDNGNIGGRGNMPPGGGNMQNGGNMQGRGNMPGGGPPTGENPNSLSKTNTIKMKFKLSVSKH